LLTLLTDALAEAQPVAADADGAETTRITRAAQRAAAGLEKRMHLFSRNAREEL